MKRKTVRKILYLLIAFMVAFPAFAWFYANYMLEFDTSEVDKYYALLSKHARPGKELVLDLGMKDSGDLSPAIDRLKSVMGLGYCRISLAYNDLKKPPAYIIDAGDNDIKISLSCEVKTRREQVNVLVHEMCHIYVRNLDKSVFGGCDQERLVDCAGVFLGLSVPILNGLTDDFFIVPGEGYESEKKFFGYIKPEQFGYLFARYCAGHGITPREVMPYLRWAGRKYLTIGFNYLKRKGYPVGVSSGAAKGTYWCPDCGSLLRTTLGKSIKGSKCPQCGSNQR